MRLKDRNRQIPGGLRFYQPETKWSPVPWSSFESIVQQLTAHRKGNPWLIKQHGWATDYNTVSAQVEDYNVSLCKTMGWLQFITEEGGQAAPEVPFRPLPNRLKNAVAGGETLVEWISTGAEAVSSELANHRASICAHCPKNGRGDWTSYFTVPVSEAIRTQINRRREMKLSTPYDDQLKVCLACGCPLPLKIHVPIELITERISPAAMAELVPQCWILAEASK